MFVEIELESPDSTSVSEIAPPDQPIVDRFVPFPSATARSRNVAVIFGPETRCPSRQETNWGIYSRALIATTAGESGR